MPRTNVKEPDDETTAQAAEPAADVAAETAENAQPLGGRAGKKKKRKYTRGLKDAQKLERGVSKAARRLSRAVARGLTTYEKRRNKSSRKKRDGAIKDAIENWGKGLGKTLRRASDAPYDVAKAMNTKNVSRQVRNAVRLITPPLFR